MRVAVFWAPPPSSTFWERGSSWLGRDAATGKLMPQPGIAGILAPRFTELTATARRYGWHATLRAPSVLKPGVTMEQVVAATRALAQRFSPFELTLQPATLAGFCALRPVEPSPQLMELATATLVAQDYLAAAPERDVLIKRAANSSKRQRELDRRWGYPYVFEHYQFHCTLAAPAALEEEVALLAAAREHFGELVTVGIAGLAVFVEPAADSPFIYQHYLPMDPNDGR